MKTFSLLILVLMTASLCAQVQYGTITYLQTSEVQIEMDEEGSPAQNKQIREMVAKMQASGAFNKTYHATFSPDAFNCVEEDKDPAEMSTESGGGTIIIMSGDEDPTHYYTDVDNGEVLNTDYIFDKGFLVSGAHEPIAWSLTGEKVAPSEMTAGLDLLLAQGINSNGDTLLAGYAPSLPLQVGPLNYHGLPGAIITLEIPNGKSKQVFRATGIEVSNEPLEISKPTKGKPVTLTKFRELQDKKEKTTIREFRN